MCTFSFIVALSQAHAYIKFCGYSAKSYFLSLYFMLFQRAVAVVFFHWLYLRYGSWSYASNLQVFIYKIEFHVWIPHTSLADLLFIHYYSGIIPHIFIKAYEFGVFFFFGINPICLGGYDMHIRSYYLVINETKHFSLIVVFSIFSFSTVHDA